VAFASGCGTAIAWTTPTVGLGCRSFNFIFYGSLAFLIAYLNVLRWWLSVSSDLQSLALTEECHNTVGGASKKQDLSSSKHTTNGLKETDLEKKARRVHLARKVASVVYWFLVFVNSLVLVLGTLFHLVGVFRTCWCERLTWSDSTLIELNSKTAQVVSNARKHWIATSYLAFGIEWLLCLVAIAGRRYIMLKMEQWPESAKEVKED
jgi:hypothetical protein